MKKYFKVALILLITSAVVAFTVKTYVEKKVADENSLLGILYQQNAAEYKALCLQAYHMARIQAEDTWTKSKDRSHLAIVTDLDETALNNSDGDAYAYKQDVAFDFAMWTTNGKPGAVPGALEFFNWAKQKGFHIYYVSNRSNSSDVVNATRTAMHALGFPNTATVADNRNFLFAPPGVSSKQPRRDTIIKRRHDQIVVLLGDNLIDIDSAFDKVNNKYLPLKKRWNAVDKFSDLWGKKYIVLPNAYYGDWEGAYYQDYVNAHPGAKPTIQQKYEIRESLLQTYDYTKGSQKK